MKLTDEWRMYSIHGRKVGAIGIFYPIITLEARDTQHALQRARRLYEEGWDHLSVHSSRCGGSCAGDCISPKDRSYRAENGIVNQERPL